MVKIGILFIIVLFMMKLVNDEEKKIFFIWTYRIGMFIDCLWNYAWDALFFNCKYYEKNKWNFNIARIIK